MTGEAHGRGLGWEGATKPIGQVVDESRRREQDAIAFPVIAQLT
jgi:hypothetical protein